MEARIAIASAPPPPSSSSPSPSPSAQLAIAHHSLRSAAPFSLRSQPLHAPLLPPPAASGSRFFPSRPRLPLVAPRAIHSSDPDFYKIPYVEGIPVGKKLKLFNLPPRCKTSELLEWFEGVKVKVESLELASPPGTQGISGFVEFETKQDACIAIVRLDGAKFRGHYVRMDFAEKRPHSKDYGSRRSTRGKGRSSMNNNTRPAPSASAPDAAAFPGTIDTTLAYVERDYARRNSNASSNPGGRSVSISGHDAKSAVDPPVSATISSHVEGRDRVSSSSVIVTDGNATSSNYGKSMNPGVDNSRSIKQGPGYIASSPGSTPGFNNEMIERIDGGKGVNAYHGSYGATQNQGFGEEVAEASPGSTPGIDNEMIDRIDGDKEVSTYNGSYSGAQNQGFGEEVAEASPGNRRIPEGGYGSYLSADDGSDVSQGIAQLSYMQGPMYGSPHPSSPHRLFVGNMDLCVDDASLQQIFSKYGTVLEARVLKEHGRSRGVAVVSMSTSSEAKEASQGLDGQLVGSKHIRVAVVAS